MNLTADIPTASEMREIRRWLDLSEPQLAGALGFAKNGERVIRAWEHGEDSPRPTAWAALRYLCAVVAQYRDAKPGPRRDKLAALLPRSLRA